MSDVLERVVVDPLIRYITKEVVKTYRKEIHLIIKQFIGNDFIVQDMMTKLHLYVHGCYWDDTNAQFQCTKMIRKILSNTNLSIIIKAIIDTGVVPRLVQFLDHESFELLQTEASWCLTNLATGTYDDTKYIIACGAVPKLTKLIESESDNVKEHAIWALGNIAGDGVECRDFVLSYDVLKKLLYFLQKIDTKSKPIQLVRTATWTLSNLCRGQPSPYKNYALSAIAILSITIKDDDDEVLQDTCWALSYLSENNVYVRHLYNNFGSRLIGLLDHSNPYIRHTALRTIGNIILEPVELAQILVNADFLPRLLVLMTEDKPSIRREACWCLSNITAGGKQQIESVIASHFIPSLITVLKTQKCDISKEALFAVCNALSFGTDYQIKYLVNEGIVEPLCMFFNPRNMKSIKYLMVALEGIDNILAAGLRMANGDVNANLYARYVEEADGVNFLKQIQATQPIPDETYDRAAQILTKYFGGKNVASDNMENMNALKCAWIKCAKDPLKIKIKLCKGCKLIGYCCRNHQKKDWNMIHSQQCLRHTF